MKKLFRWLGFIGLAALVFSVLAMPHAMPAHHGEMTAYPAASTAAIIQTNSSREVFMVSLMLVFAFLPQEILPALIFEKVPRKIHPLHATFIKKHPRLYA